MPAALALLRNWRLWGLLALVALLGLQTMRVSDAKADAAEARAALSSDRARYAEDAKTATETQRKIEADRQAESERIRNEAREKIATAEGDARRAADAADGLRREVARLLAARRAVGSNPGPGAGSAPAGDALDLFADMLDRHSRELVEVGGYADRARLAGLACEASYDSLSREVRP